MNAIDDRMYENYASTHAGSSDAGSTALIYRAQIRPHLPAASAGRTVLDIGCGQGALVRQLACDGFSARGIDISPEQVALAHAEGLHQVQLGDFHELLSRSSEGWDAVIATDVLEHLDKAEALRAFEGIRRSLRPGGVFIGRVPNAVSPTGGHVMFSDLTHHTYFTQRSILQLAAVAGFGAVRTFACPPVAHGVVSATRSLLWAPISGLLKLALAAETGQLRGHIVTHNLVFAAYRDPSTTGRKRRPEPVG
jgi:2-polyprenyl-3-methyl-5-hydroxy-6-metoxy-1,4-benzoquinol methylase